MKRVLIITYYWPPLGGGFVQRVSKFCKFLPACGWEPIVLTVQKKTYPNSDASMLDEVKEVNHVFKAPSIEVHGIYNKIAGKKHEPGNVANKSSAGGSPGRFHRFADMIRVNAFIPDARIGWLPQAVRLGRKAIEETKPDIIFSTAPPFTVNLVAKKLKKKSKLPWVADFRDPWLENCAYNTVPRLGLVKKINQRMEVGTYRAADRVICVSQRQLDMQAAKVPEADRGKFTLLRNGYDATQAPDEVTPSEKFYLSYLGSIYPQRFPVKLVDAIRKALDRDPEFSQNFCFRLIGDVTGSVRERLETELGLDHVEFIPFQAQSEVNKILYETQVLLITVNEAPLNELITPGKLYQYIPTGNPVLGIGPVGGEVDHLINEHKAGKFFDYNDSPGMEGFLLDCFQNWQAGNLNRGASFIEAFDRQSQARQLAGILDSLTG